MLSIDDELLAPFRALHRGSRKPGVRQAVLDAVATERPLENPVDGRLLLAGDWHGNGVVAQRAVGSEADGLSHVLQLGDFGVWRGDGGEGYLDVISTVLLEHDRYLLVVDGNHEDFPILQCYPLREGLRVLRPHLYHLPRGFRWQWRDADGRNYTWLAVGGAASVDAAQRAAGRDWWPDEEELSDDDADRIAGQGRADVVVCHDRPEAAAWALHDPPGLWHTRAPAIWDRFDLRRSDLHSARLQGVIDAVQPGHVWHGHLHQRTDAVIEESAWGPYRIHGMADDTAPGGNAVQVGVDGSLVP